MRFAGVLAFLLLGAGPPLFAVQSSTDKDQQIKDLKQQIDDLSARVKQLETREPAPAGDLEHRLDGAVRQNASEALSEPRRLNISAPGLEGLDISGLLHMRGQYWGNYINGALDPVTGTRGHKDDGVSLGTEALLGFNAKISENTHVYIEAHAADEWGNSTAHGLGGIAGTTQNTTNNTDIRLNQAYLKWADVSNIGGDLTIGRQKIEYGDERMIGDDEWNFTRTDFDGLRWDKDLGDCGDLSITAIRIEDTDVVNSTLVPTGFGHEDNAELYGIYYTTKKQDPFGTVDLYLFQLEDRNRFNGPGKDPQTRFTTYGTRWASPNWAGLWFDVEGATQFGHFNGVDTNHNYGFDIWATHLGGGYKIENMEFVDGVFAAYDYATGGDDVNHQHTFVQLYPSLHGWFGITDLFSWSNIQHEVIGANFKVGKGTLAASYHWNRMASSNGMITGYTNEGGLDLIQGANQGKDLGEEADLVYSVMCGKATNVDLGVGYFFPGDAYTAATAGGRNNITYAYVAFRTLF